VVTIEVLNLGFLFLLLFFLISLYL
jgi:hypothetical protein